MNYGKMDYDMYKLRDWISLDKLNIAQFSRSTNPEAIKILRKYYNDS
jgi:hypothetical protein